MATILGNGDGLASGGLIPLYHKNEKGEIVSEHIGTVKYTVFDSKISMKESPDLIYPFTIKRTRDNKIMERVDVSDFLIGKDQYRVDEHGFIVFDNSMNGEEVEVSSYCGRGGWAITDENILVVNDNNRIRVGETLKKYLDLIKSDGLRFPVNTTGDGDEYLADVPGLKVLIPGITIGVKFHTNSTTVAPTLNINNLGVVPIKRKSLDGGNSFYDGKTADWLNSDRAYILIYDGAYWLAEGLSKLGSHASISDEFGPGNLEQLGHLKLSDSTDSTDNVNNSTAATPLAVNTIQSNLDKHAKSTTSPVHGSTSEAMVSCLMHRDDSGRAKVIAPKVDLDIANKKYVDDADDILQTELDKKSPEGHKHKYADITDTPRIYHETSSSATQRKVVIPGIKNWDDILNIPVTIQSLYEGSRDPTTLNISGDGSVYFGAKALYLPDMIGNGVKDNGMFRWSRIGVPYIVVWDGTRVTVLNPQVMRATSDFVGIVQPTGTASSQDRVKNVRAPISLNTFNEAARFRNEETPVSFSGNIPGAPPGLNASTAYYGVLWNVNYSATSVDTAYGVRQELTIAKIKKRWERYVYIDSATDWGEWKEIPNSDDLSGVVKMVNGLAPDSDGNVNVAGGGGGIGTGTVTAVNSGAGMDFVHISTSGTVALGTPSDVTNASTNSVSGTTHTHKLADSSVTNAKMASMATNTIKGNNNASNAAPVDLTVTQVKAMLELQNVTNESKATMLTDTILTGTPTAPTAPRGTKNKQLATTEFVLENVSTASFVYNCTGTDDNLAIEQIINDFLDNGTAMSMSLKIVGKSNTMAFSPRLVYGNHIDEDTGDFWYSNNNYSDSDKNYIVIDSRNTRGATVYLDCYDWEINKTGLGGSDRHFIMLYGGGKLSVKGLYLDMSSLNFGAVICSFYVIYNGMEPFFPTLILDTDNTVRAKTGVLSVWSYASKVFIKNNNSLNGVFSDSFGSIGTGTATVIENDNIILGNVSAYGIDYLRIGYSNILGDVVSDYINNNTYDYNYDHTLYIGDYNNMGNILISAEQPAIIGNFNNVGSIFGWTGIIMGDNNVTGSIDGSNFYGFKIGDNNKIKGSNFGLKINDYGGTRYTNMIGSNNIFIATGSGGIGLHIMSGVGTVKIDGAIIIGKAIGLQIDAADTSINIMLVNCQIKGDEQDVKQTSVADSISWHIEGNIFSKTGLMVDGTSVISYKTASTNIYFPQYANKFNKIIDTPQFGYSNKW